MNINEYVDTNMKQYFSIDSNARVVSLAHAQMSLWAAEGTSHYTERSGASSTHRPQDAGMVESVHELHFSQHVGSIAAQLVHLQSHHLVGRPVVDLKKQSKDVAVQLNSDHGQK